MGQRGQQRGHRSVAARAAAGAVLELVHRSTAKRPAYSFWPKNVRADRVAPTLRQGEVEKVYLALAKGAGRMRRRTSSCPCTICRGVR